MMKFFFVFLIMFVVSCSNIRNDLCRINGNEYYLDTNPLCEVHMPSGYVLPVINEKYTIPTIIDDGQLKIGKNLDICPPIVGH